MKKPNIIFILMDAISFKYSWLHNNEYMPQLFKKKIFFKNYLNHYSTARNTKGNFPSILSGIYPHLHKVNNKAHKFADNKYGHFTQVLKNYGYKSYYFGTQAFSGTEQKKIILDFDHATYLSPSMADYYVPGLKFNQRIKSKINEIDNNPYFLFLHYTDAHAPFETPNINYLKLFSKKFPKIRNFLIKNSLNLNILRRFRNKYLNKGYHQLDKKYFKEYPNLKNDILYARGPLLSPERYPNFYDYMWEDKDLFNEYKQLLKMAYLYQDLSVNSLLDYIAKFKKDNTMIILTSDHINNDVVEHTLSNKGSLLDDESLHIPLSILSFDEDINRNYLNSKETKTYTSHIDFYNTFSRIFDQNYTDNDYEINLLNITEKNRYLMAQSNNDRQHHNQTRLFNDKESIDIYTQPSNEMPDIIDNKNIINDLSKEKYDKYSNYVKNFNIFYKKRLEN